jgi:hypothetical protein
VRSIFSAQSQVCETSPCVVLTSDGCKGTEYSGFGKEFLGGGG